MKLLLLLFISLPFIAYSQFNYLPKSSSNANQIVKHNYYTLSYSEADEQAEWVAYRLTKIDLNGQYLRTDNFRPDPQVSSGSAQLADFSFGLLTF